MIKYVEILWINFKIFFFQLRRSRAEDRQHHEDVGTKVGKKNQLGEGRRGSGSNSARVCTKSGPWGRQVFNPIEIVVDVGC